VLPPDRLQITQECLAVGEVRHRSEECEPASIMKRDQPGEEEANPLALLVLGQTKLSAVGSVAASSLDFHGTAFG
jgi:hypothetical protein